MKRFFGMVVVLVLLAAVVTVSVSAQVVTLRWQSVHHAEPQIIPLRDRLIAEFEEANPGIRIEKVIVPRADDWTRFVTAAQAGRTPDIYDVGSANLAQAVDQRWIQPVHAFVSEEDLEHVLPNVLERVIFEDEIWTWPFWAGAYGTFYNTRMLQEAGLDENNLPQTWDEYLEWVLELTKDTTGDGLIDQYGMGDVLGRTNTNFNHHMMFLWSFGGELLNEDMTESLLDTPEAIEALRFRAELSTKYGVRPPGPTGYEYLEMTNAFAFERIATMISAQWAIAKIEIDNPEIAGQYVIGPIPRGVESATFGGFNSQAIGRDSQHPEEAWKFIQFLNSKENAVARGMEAGWIPVRGDAITDERIQNHAIGPFAELMFVSRSLPSHPAIPEITNIGIAMIHDVLLGNKTAEEAAEWAAREANAVLDRF